MTKAVLIYPHQLFEKHPLINDQTKSQITVFLIEEPLMFTQFKFHKQKLILHRASMQAFRDLLVKDGYQAKYIEISQLGQTGDIGEILVSEGIKNVSFCEVTDDWLNEKLTKALDAHKIKYEVVDTPLFLTSQADLDSFFKPLIEQNKKFLMGSFYIWQRKRLNVLIDQGKKPVGGKWSHDEENRQKIPKSMILPSDPIPSTNQYAKEAHNYIEQNFNDNYGTTEAFFYPVTHIEAKNWLKEFLEAKLELFGPFEDAITTEGAFLYHSILSPLINIGLLTPEYVLEQTLEYAQKNTVQISSLEGFIRQIIGWREYIRAVYIYKGRQIRAKNYFESKKELPESFWTGETRIKPVDDTIQISLKYGYAHHIPRLMIMGNFMNLCGFEPNQVYKWFMEMYVDSYDWVMVANVYSMALYSDGGLITTKPYISGSSYILKMSNYKKDDWAIIWDALFWNFVGLHYEKLSKEGRLGFIGITYSKMSQEKKDFHNQIANKFLLDLK